MTPTHLDAGPPVSLRAVWPHHGVAADRVRALKYGDRSAAVSILADAMAPLAPPVDVVTWCPASPSARAARGFDQSELLARAIGHRLRVPVRRLLRRDRRDRPQTERDRAGRLAGPALRPLGRLRRAPSVLVVDDVATTGTTLAVAASVLTSAGAGAVHGLVATRAARPDPPRRFEAGLTPRAGPVYGRAHNRVPEVTDGRLHQRTAREHHAATGGGDP